MNISERPDSFEPGDYLAVLRRRWWIVLCVAILGLLAAGAYVKVAHKVYTSSASVYVTATGAEANQVSGGRTTGTVNMDSEAQVVQSISVAVIAAHLLHSDLSPSALSKNVKVTVPPNSQVLQIGCNAPTADAAAACAQQFATAYLQNRTTSSTDLLNATLKSLQSQVATLEQDISKLTGKIDALPPNSTQLATSKAERSSDTSQLSALNKQVGVLAAQGANSSPGSIITNAVPPGAPTSPQKLLIVPSGLVVGLLLGLVLAFLIDRRDKRIHGARDIERYLGLPLLLSIPEKKSSSKYPSLVGPRSRVGHAFAELASSVGAALGEGNHVLVVAGTSMGPGGSLTAANLAGALARTHSEVFLVCADLDDSMIPELFHLGQGRGLAEVLAGTATVDEVARRPADFPRLRVLMPGADTSVSLYNFQHDVTHGLVSQLRDSASFVIIEGQAASEAGDAFALAEFADAALVVAVVGKTTRPQVADCVRRLDLLRTSVLGAVLIPSSGRRRRPEAGGNTAKAVKPAKAGKPGKAGSAEPAEQRPAQPETRPRAVPASARVEPRPMLKVGTRDMNETWPLPLSATRANAEEIERAQRNRGKPEEPADKNTEN